MKNISLDVRADGIGVATMDMPGLPFNIFSEDMMADFDSLIEIASNELKGLVICSGKSAYVAGADLGMIKDFARMRFDSDWQTMRDRYSYLGQMFRRLEQVPVPVVAAINGLALGGGLELAMSCHGRVCIESEAPILGLPEIVLSLLPGAGGTQRLPRYVGLEKALEMLLVGNPISPVEAKQLGLIDELTTPDELIEKAVAMAQSIEAKAPWDKADWSLSEHDQNLLAQSDCYEQCLAIGGWADKQHSLYPAVAAIIDAVCNGAPLAIDAAFKVEWDIFVGLMTHPIAANMVVTCFLNKTAAGKWAKANISSEAQSHKTLAWQSQQRMGRGVDRKFELQDQAELSVVDAAQAGEQGQIVLNDVLAGAPSTASINYVGNLKTAEAVEINAPAELSASVVKLASAMGKIPVWSLSPQGGLTVMSQAIQALTVDAQLLAAAKAVDALPMLARCGIDVSAADTVEPSVIDRAKGLDMLAQLALTIYSELKADFEATDVLAVFGIAWPQWTGGPMAYLAMVQRDEALGVSANVSSQVKALKQRFKTRASYSDLI